MLYDARFIGGGGGAGFFARDGGGGGGAFFPPPPLSAVVAGIPPADVGVQPPLSRVPGESSARASGRSGVRA